MKTDSKVRMPSGSAIKDLWAKSPMGRGQRGESLPEHTAWVLTRLADLRQLRPELGAQIGNPELWSQLYWAGFIHDFGKAARGFQEQVRPGGPKWGKRHEVLSLAFLTYIAEPGSEEWVYMAAAIAAHHKEKDVLSRVYNLNPNSRTHREQMAAMVEEIDGSALVALWEWFQERGREWAIQLGFGDSRSLRAPKSPESAVAFHARASGDICEALGAYYGWVDELAGQFSSDPPALNPFFLRGLLMTADHSGSAHSASFERAPLPEAAAWLEQFRAEWEAVHPHQSASAAVEGNIRLVAPTGSGKTESALLWAANQRGQDGAQAARLFYVLPYQASMNAMYDRLAGHFGEGSISLQHGKARHALYRRYLERDESAEKAQRSAAAARNLARLHVPPIRVLSPYQLLKPFYRLRGYEASLADLQGGVFICDEIHAYEVKRLSLILAMMGYLHRHFDARFCLMSATFPSLLKKWLDEEMRPLTDIVAAPETQEKFRRHYVRLSEQELTDPELVNQIVRAAAGGLSVLVCCNTVRRAQIMLSLLEDQELEPVLLHSRFNARDRLDKERALQREMGTRTRQANARYVMVATQVVEVSLDIDFDILFTDLAPMDALLQRIGRINRSRKRDLQEIVICSGPIVHNRPYDEQLLLGALAILTREFGNKGAPMDEGSVSDWLDEIYAGDLAERWQAEFLKSKREFTKTVLGELYPFQADDALEDLFYEAFDGTEVLPLCLRDEYNSLLEDRPLEASELLVGIRWDQLRQLFGHGAIVDRIEADRTPVADRPYSDRLGLELY